jgi:16S rRNA (guanine527-N7)-methyltransferase
LAQRYADHLAHAGVERGLIGPREVDRLWERHLLNSAAISAWVPKGASVADIGSGAGLPGIPLALARPDLHLTLIEPLLRRATYLDEVVADLGLGERVAVVRARADALHGKRTFDVVTARAVAPLDRLAGWALPLVRLGGELLALKGENAQAELDASQALLVRWGAIEAVVLESLDDPVVRAIRVVPTASPDGVTPLDKAADRHSGGRGRRRGGPGSSPDERGRP